GSQQDLRVEAGQYPVVLDRGMPTEVRKNASPIPGIRGSGWDWGANMLARVAGLSTQPCGLAPPPRRAARCASADGAPSPGRSRPSRDQPVGAQVVVGGSVEVDQPGPRPPQARR